MQCRYCHRDAKPNSAACAECDLLISIGDWELLAHSWLFWHPQDWEADVAAFLEATEGGVEPSRQPAVSPSLSLAPQQVEVIRAALADAYAYCTPEGYCRDCDTLVAGLCPDHRRDVLRRIAYRALADQLAAAVSDESGSVA